MSKISIIVPDRMVIVDGLAHQIDLNEDMLTDMVKAPIHAIQFENGRAEIEYGRPMNARVTGDAAMAYIKQYVEAWSVQNEKALSSSDDPTKKRD